ncbi:MAG: transglutaminase domain-containing protein [Actinomycetes bacterium]
MKSSRKLLYFFSFVGLAATAVVAIAGIGAPTIAPLLLAALVAAALVGAPGLIHRRAWPVALVLLPLGAYLLLRLQLPIPAHVHGVGQEMGFYLEQARSGASAYSHDDFPLDFAAGTGVGVLLSLVVYAALGAAAFFALSLRKALPAIVIVLALLGFGLTTDETARVVWTPFAFLLLAGCMLALSRSLGRERWRATDALAGAATATLAALLALSLVGATSVAASKPLQDWRTWGLAGSDGALLGFNWMENYARLLDPLSDARVMRVRSPVASYWRANTLGDFNGIVWFGGASYGDVLAHAEAPGTSVYTVPPSYPEPPGRLVKESFEIVSTYTDHLFTGGSPRSLLFAPQATLWVTDARALRIDQALGPTLDYSIEAVIPQVTPADLLDRGADYPTDVVGKYAALPFPRRSDFTGPSPEAAWRVQMSHAATDREWLGLYRMNEDIVGTTTDPYGIALAIEEYLRSGFTYSLEPPRNGFASPYAAFLFRTKTGYCQHFAGAMAVLLRFNGIPARVAVGFSPGERAKDGAFDVRRNDAHAWVEVYFPGVGWMPFDPTPGRTIPGSGVSSASAGFVDPFSAAGGPDDAAVPAASTAGSRGLRPEQRAAAGGVGSSGTVEQSGISAWLPLGGALALVAWPVGRAAVRRRGLRRGSRTRRLRASLALTYADLRDYGVLVPPSQTLDETARFLMGSFELDAGPLMDRIQAVLFGGRAATEEDLAAVAAFRRQLKRRMRARRGRVRAILALYGIPAT